MNFEMMPLVKRFRADNSRFEELFGKTAGHMRMGLSRTTEALTHLQQYLGWRLEDRCFTYLIGGTNGKGSTAGYLCQILQACGLRVGLYTSPHFVNYQERFYLSFADTTNEELLAVWSDLQKEILPPDLYQQMSFFELSTVIAYLYFARQDLDVAIFEVGLGGRLDSTNALDPKVSAVCSIGLDHMEYLGDSHAAIAKEKAAIRRAGAELFWGETAEESKEYQEVMDAIREDASIKLRVRGVDFGLSEHSFWLANPQHRESWQHSIPPNMRKTAPYLKRNLSLALALADSCLNSRAMAVSMLDQALSLLPSLPRPPSLWGRFQPVAWQLTKDLQLELMLDCCHNIAGCEAFLDSLAAKAGDGKGPIPRAFVSILRDKQVNEMLDLLRARLPELLLFQVANERSITLQDLAPRHRDLQLFPDFLALRDVLLQSPGDLRPAVVCGSIYALGEVLRLVGHEIFA